MTPLSFIHDYRVTDFLYEKVSPNITRRDAVQMNSIFETIDEVYCATQYTYSGY